jgi:phosphate transport system permease protein
MNLKIRNQVSSFFRKKKKENLLIGSLLFVSAIIALLPGAIHLINGLYSLSFSIVTLDEYVSVIMFSLLMILPSIILFCMAYLLWEAHSYGWKLSIAACGIAVLLAIATPAFMYFALPIAILSGLAALLGSQNKKGAGSQIKDSPITIENVVKVGLRLSALICFSVLVAMVVFIVAMATPFLSIQLFTSMNLNYVNVGRICYGLPPVGSIGGVLSCTIGSLLVVTFCEFVAVPVGIGAAIYLAEYSGQNRLISTLRFFIEILAGAPSVIIAIIGFAIFTQTFHWNYSLYSGAIALSFMALPWNIRVAEEAIKSVPRSYREASFALGATQWQTARQVMLYAAMPGIITGILLGIGVALGETLVLQMNFSGATLTGLPNPWWHIFNLRQQLPALTVFIYSVPGDSYILSGSGFPRANPTNADFFTFSLALAAATVLITIYLVLCIGALLLRNHLNKKMKGS